MCVVVRGSIIKYEEKKNKKKKPTPKVDAIHISCESIPLPIISDDFFILNWKIVRDENRRMNVYNSSSRESLSHPSMAN